MKNLTFANGKLVLLVLLLGYFGCTPETIKPNPDPTPTPSRPSITVNSVSPSSKKLVYNGAANPQTTVTIDFTVTGATTPATVNGVVVLNGLFTSPPISSGQKFVIQASNAQGPTSETVDIAVEIDPVMALLTNGKFVMVKKIVDTTPNAMACEYDDTTSFSLAGKRVTVRGDACPGSVQTTNFYLNSEKNKLFGWFDDVNGDGADILKVTSDSLNLKTYSSTPNGLVPVHLFFKRVQ